MADPQRIFLSAFRSSFKARFPSEECVWGGGQAATNTGGLIGRPDLRRHGKLRPSEVFELGDLRASFRGASVLVEFDQSQMDIRNLLKYWPYICGELSAQPSGPVVLCHFSRWHSYGSFRDLWAWTAERMADDAKARVPFLARQFDHWAEDPDARSASIATSLDWIGTVCSPAGRFGTLQGREDGGPDL